MISYTTKEKMMTNKQKKIIKFSLEGGSDVPIYEAVDIHPQKWNGWLVPIVTFETAQQIADDLFDPECDTEQPSQDIVDSIIEAKENFEDAVDVGCGICWLEV